MLVDMEEHNKQLIVKSNQLVESSYKLTTQEQRIILLMASMIKSEDEDFKLYRIDINRFMNLIGVTGHSKYSEIQTTTEKLLEKVLIIRDGESVLQLSWLSSAEYFKGKGYVELEFSPKLRPYLLQLKDRFTSYQLKNVIRLKRSYSVRLYELLKQYEKIGERYFLLENFKKIIWIRENEYQRYNDLKKRIILPAQKELAERTDILFDFEEDKQGRKVIGIKFKIFKNEIEEEKVVEILESELCNLGLYQRLKDYFCLSSAQAIQVLHTYEEKRLMENLTYVEIKVGKGEVENIGAYTIKAIEENFKIQMSLFGVEKKEKEEKKKLEEKINKEEITRQKELRTKADLIYKSLSEKERKRVEEEAKTRAKKEIDENSPGFNAHVKFVTRVQVVKEKYDLD